MQAVVFATSGMVSLHSRMASGVQACCTSGGVVPWAPAWGRPQANRAQTGRASRQAKSVIRIGSFPVFEDGLAAKLAGETSAVYAAKFRRPAAQWVAQMKPWPRGRLA